jgi:hypothetical protein
MPFTRIEREGQIARSNLLEDASKIERLDANKKQQPTEVQSQEIYNSNLNKQLEYLQQCFQDSGIDGITDTILQLYPGVSKEVMRIPPSRYNPHGELKIPKKVFVLGLDVTTVDEYKNPSLSIYETIQLTWDLQSVNWDEKWKQLTVGFSLDGSLIIDGRKTITLSENIWRGNQSVIEGKLEDAFMNPENVYKPYVPPEVHY